MQNGIPVGGYGNGTPGNDLKSLSSPTGMSMSTDNFLYVCDSKNARVIKLQEGSLTGSIAAGTGTSGSDATQLNLPIGLFVDASSNIYITDSFNCRVMLWHKTSSSGVLAADITNVPGNTSSTFIGPTGVVVDSVGNMYISDTFNHRVMKWAPNATNGTLQTGTGVPGNNSRQLNQPLGIYLDESNSYLYISDSHNHRIQRYQLRIATNGTTVAGGNGSGIGNHQLNTPYTMCVSKTTGAIYIADAYNHRIQRWSPGATSGVLIAGVAGVSGTTSAVLNKPVSVVFNHNETYIYVSEMDNNRVQCFKLI